MQTHTNKSQHTFSSENMGVLRLPKLSKPADYLRWKRYVYAYIRRDDPLLKCFTEGPAENQRGYVSWAELNAKAKSVIVLSLGDEVIAKVRVLVDEDDKTAKELWDELARIHTTSSTQKIANLHQKLDNLMYDESTNFDKHISNFLSIIDELASLDQLIQESDKATKLIRSLPPSFDALAMATSVNKLNFDELVTAIHANIERRRKSSNKHDAPRLQAYTSRAPGLHSTSFRGRGRGNSYRGRRGGRGRGGSNISRANGRACHYCGKEGHFIRFCRMKMMDEGRGNNSSNQNLNRGNRRNLASNGNYISSRWTENANRAGQTGNRNEKLGDNGEDSNFGTELRANIANRPREMFDDAPPPWFDTVRNQPGARMARFRSNVAKLKNEKVDEGYIDTGATHHFFHRRSMFQQYESINPEKVSVAHGNSMFVGKGMVQVPIGDGIHVEAYHAPEFSSNILASHLLSEMYNILQTSDNNWKRCEILKKGSRNDVIMHVECIQGL